MKQSPFRGTLMVVLVALCAMAVVSVVTGAVLMNVAASPRVQPRQQVSAPVSDFTAAPTSGVVPLAVQFTDTWTDPTATWSWNFGDGTTSHLRNPLHTYAAAGTYTVSLIASNARGSRTTTRTSYVTVNPPSQWTTIIDDQFNTPGVPSHWSVYNGSYSGDAHNCAAPSQVQVPGDGYLHLKMQYLTTGLCGPGWYTGGMQIAPQYGGVDQAITVRWRIVPSADPSIVRSQRVIPMRWVDDPKYAWYQGESDYCEGGHLGGCYTFLHYGPNGQQIIQAYTVDLTQWHTWRVEVHNHRVSVFIDDLTKPVWVFTGDQTTTPSAIMRTVLQQECPLTGCPSSAYAGDTEDIQIDWITIQNYTGGNAGATPGGAQSAGGASNTAPGSSPVAYTPHDEMIAGQTAVSLGASCPQESDLPKRCAF